MKSYEIIEHTADVGLKIRGKTLQDLFRNAGCGLYSLITDFDSFKESAASEPSRPVRIRLPAENAGDLLLKWLRELIYLFSAKRLLFCDFQFERITEKELLVHAAGKKFDPARHEQNYEIKAVTYHHFRLEKQKSGWTAEVIFDI